MSTPSLQELSERLRPFLRERRVKKAIVFGSWSRGTQTRRSDLDLALVMDTDRRFLERYDHILGIEDVLDGVHADVLIYAPGELEAISHRPFIRDLLTQGIIIHEQ